MTITLISIFLLLFWGLIFRPVVTANLNRQQYEFQKNLRNFKLIAIKKYHPAFQIGADPGPLDYEEIAQRYNVSELYEQIGASSKLQKS